MLNKLFEFSYCEWRHDTKSSEVILKEVLENIKVNQTLLDQGIVLFMLSEFVRKNNRMDYLKNEKIQVLIDSIEANWQDQSAELLTLGSIYGGLRNLNLYLKQDTISLTLKTMKAYVFKNYIKKGQLCSNLEKTQTKPEMLLVCIPFGLFEPEDLVFVEAVKHIQKQMYDGLLSETDALLLAWYYLEQGTHHITRDILKQTTNQDALYQLIFGKLEAVNERFILHTPYGNDNRYEPGDDERFPKLVKAGEPVTFKVISFPISADDPVIMRCNNKTITGQIVAEKYWQFKAGPFNARETVEYHFQFENTPDIQTSLFEFEVSKIGVLGKVVGVSYTNTQDANLSDDKSLDSETYDVIQETMTLITNDLILKFQIDAHGVLSVAVNALSEEERISTKWTKPSDSQVLTLENGDYKLEYPLATHAISYFQSERNLFTATDANWLKFTQDHEQIRTFTCTFQNRGEKFYGFGERYNALNQSGHTPDNFVYNQYKEQGLRTYIPMPFFTSDRGYGMLLDTTAYSAFNMAEENPTEYSIEVESDVMSLKVIPGDIKAVIEENARLSGYPVMLPKWAFGPWMSSNNWDSDAEVRKQVLKTMELDIPATVLVIEAWSDEATFYLFNDATYKETPGENHHKYDDFKFPTWGRWPDPKGLVKHLHDHNLKCILWQIPIIKQISSLHHLQKEADEQYFIEKGFGVLNADGTPYRIPEGWFKDSLLMDFSNQEAVNWWFKKRQYLIDDLGVDGFKTDGGEFVFGRDLKFHDGRTGHEMRNAYPNDYIGAYYKFAQQNNGITFSRAGYRGANQFPAHWAGDERSNFDAFKRSILAGLSSGISGLPFWGWDLAGFSGDVPTAELFVRATQMATFCPIMQYHAESKGEHNQDRTPWNIYDRSGDMRAITAYRYYANLRMNLIPYIYREALKASRTGLPLMRAMIVDFESDPNTHEIWDQYMFGDQLMIAPIINEGENERNVYFPKGEWINFFTGKVMNGPKNVIVSASLDEIPVYVKANTIIPLNLGENFKWGDSISNELNAYKHLCFRIFGVPETVYYFEDDLNTEISIKVKKSTSLEFEIEIEIESNLNPIYLIFDGKIDKVSINGVIRTTQLLTFETDHISLIEI
ncbi:glycoside hydrolase family 31 protein [Fusibacter ferrireducens]|uniref:Glycosyl hydrolase n=1 Tax=Fusibacter ferrireducens TaxID=2785058 RepID=A0ABR9ZND4_9FIRM|nr:TIM-barrel domain-containing protein [Fusibacter ferrireducens]MBF4691967.1 glycosyl hydrolase [Fusibacter ferrireducens]